MIYKPAVGDHPSGRTRSSTAASTPASSTPRTDRSLAQTFADNATGGVVTVAVNHLKSKGSSCADVGDPDAGDGSGNCNGTRTMAPPRHSSTGWRPTRPGAATPTS